MNNYYYNNQYLSNINGSNSEAYCTFEGWSLDEEIIDNGNWFEYYSDNDIYLYAKWIPVNYTYTLNYNDGRDNEQFNYTYFSIINLEEPVRSGYRFNTWEDQNGISRNKIQQLIGDITLTAEWNEIYTIICQSTTTFNLYGILGEKIDLPSLTSGYFYVYKWGNYPSNEKYTVVGNITLSAVWKGNSYNIIYNNITFMGQTAGVILNNHIGNDAPIFYEYGIGLDISRVSAFFQTSSPYSPQLRFLGWYTDENFSTTATSISNTNTGTVNLYAKWRYDYDNPGRIGEYTIKDVNASTQSHDELGTGLTYNNTYQNLYDLGIRYLVIKFYLRMWEVSDGYQEIMVWQGNNMLWSDTEINYGGNSINTTPGIYTATIEIPITQIQNASSLGIYYSAHGWGSDTWQNDYLYTEFMYVTDPTDISTPDFTWSYQNPFN